MKKKQKEIIFFISLLIILVYIYMPKKKPVISELTGLTGSNLTIQEELPSQSKKEVTHLSLKSSFKGIKRDPFELPMGILSSSSDLDEEEFVLTGIIITGERKVAIINGKMVKEGDTISGYKIENIDINSVDIHQLQTDEIFTLRQAK